MGFGPHSSRAQQAEVPISHAQVCPGGVCAPGALQALVDAEPAGTAFRLGAGLYREQGVVPRDGDTFVGGPGAILSGAREATSTLEPGGQFWTVEIAELIGRERHGSCVTRAACDYAGQLFLGGTLLFQVDVAGPAELQPGEWHFDELTGIGSFVDDPTGLLVEVSVTPEAFSGSAQGATIRDLVVERYANRAQRGAVEAGAGTDWLIQNVEIRENNGYGLNAGGGLRALGNHIHRNGLAGIGGSGAGGALDVLIEGNEIAFNHNGGFSGGWERGGLKITNTVPADPAVPTLVIRGNHVHHNDGPGLWTDIGASGVLVEGNTVEDNANEGIKHEISGQATIRNNVVSNNGRSFDAWLWGSQILVQNSADTEVTGNIVTVAADAGDGIGVINQVRSVDAVRVSVHDNRIVQLGLAGQSGIVDDTGSAAACQPAAGNSFDRNVYEFPTGVGAVSSGRWAACSDEDWEGFRAAGHEADGSLAGHLQLTAEVAIGEVQPSAIELTVDGVPTASGAWVELTGTHAVAHGALPAGYTSMLNGDCDSAGAVTRDDREALRCTVTLALPGVVFAPAFGGRVFIRPIELVQLADGRHLVAEQAGRILVLDDAGPDDVLLDITTELAAGGSVAGQEGLLSFALDPAYPASPYLYVSYSVRESFVSTLARFTVVAGVTDPTSELILIEVPQPFRDHNGNAIRFGPDGMLYWSIGDGGLTVEPPPDGQDVSTLRGTVIRIDVAGASDASPYAIPADNPDPGIAGARPEIWAYGFRNPWRMSFDGVSGALILGDNGQDTTEEVNVVTAGGNYGWALLEGNDCYPPGSSCDPAGTVAPAASYDHSHGCSVIGGVVYRGQEIPHLAGSYLVTDFCSGTVWALPLDLSANLASLGSTGANVVSFGVDNAGEVYLLSSGGTILRLALVASPVIDDIGCAPLDPFAGQQVDCNPQLSGGPADSHEWTVDGAGAGANPTLATVFAAPGAHMIELTVCSSGGCATAESSVTVSPATRVTDGLLALYAFDEGGGTSVADTSGFGSPAATIADPGSVTWLSGGGLSFDAPGIAASEAPADAIAASIVATNAVTLEAWVRPVNTTLVGPARAVTISRNSSSRSITLGQQGTAWVVRLRTTTTGANGLSPAISASGTVVPGQLTHVLYTRDAAGAARLYIDGVERAMLTVAGDLSNWDLSQFLAFGNELTNDRPWLGELHLAAFYERALAPLEVTRNFETGPLVAAATGPTVAVEQAAGQADPTSASPVEFTVTFSEDVSGFDAADVDLSASTAPGTLLATVSGGPAVYTVAVSGMTGDGIVTASVPAGAAVDGAADPSQPSTSIDGSISYDASAPTVTVEQAAGQADPTNGSTVEFTVTFSEAVSGFDAADVDLGASTAAGTLVATVSGGPAVHTVAVSGMTGDGIVTASVPAAAAVDGAANLSQPSTSSDNAVSYDTSQPPPAAVSLLSGFQHWDAASSAGTTYACPASSTGKRLLVFGYGTEEIGSAPNNPSSIQFGTTSMTQAVTGSATSGGGANENRTGIWYLLDADIEAGPQRFTISWPGGTPNDLYAWAVCLDDVDQTTPISATGTDTVDEQNVTLAFADGDMTLHAANTGGPNTASAWAADTDYTAAFASGDSSSAHAVQYRFMSGSGSDTATYDNSGSPNRDNSAAVTVSATRTAATGPTVAVEQAVGQADPTSASPVEFTVTFSESVTGFEAADVDLSASTAPGTLLATVSGGPAVYTVAVSGMTGDGIVTASVPAGAAVDGAADPSQPSTSIDGSISYDASAPTVTVEQAAGQADPTNGSTVEFTVTFSEAVSGFDSADVDLSASTAPGTLVTTVGGGPAVHTVAVSGMTGDGIVTASVPAAAAVDGAANLSQPSTSSDNTVSYDTSQPPPAAVSLLSGFQHWDAASSAGTTYACPTSSTGKRLLVFGYGTEEIGSAPNNPSSIQFGTTSMTQAVTGNATSGGGANENRTGIWYLLDADIEAGPQRFTISWPGGTPNDLYAWAVCLDDVDQSTPIGATGTDTVDEQNVSLAFADGDMILHAANTGGPNTASAWATDTDYTAAFASGDSSSAHAVQYRFMSGSGSDTATYDNSGSPNRDNSVAVTVSAARIAATGPTVAVEQAVGQADPTGASPVEFTVTFSEAVTGFEAADVDLSASTAPGTLLATVSGGPAVYTVAVSGMTGDGIVTASVAAGAAVDGAADPSQPSTSIDGSISYDASAPTVTVEQAAGQADPTNGSTVEFTVLFSEAVSGFDAADVDLGASTAAGTLVATVSGGPAVYTVAVSGMTGDGIVTASVPAAAAVDAVANLSQPSTSSDNAVSYDTSQPPPAAVSLLSGFQHWDAASSAGTTYACPTSSTGKRLLVFGYGTEEIGSAPNNPSSIQFGTASMSHAVTENATSGGGANENRTGIWYLLDADIEAGPQRFTISWPGGTPNDLYAWAVCLDDVDQTTPISATGTDTVDEQNVTLAFADGDMILHAANTGGPNTASAWAADTDYTAAFASGDSSSAHAVQYRFMSGSGSDTATYDNSGSPNRDNSVAVTVSAG